MQPEWTRRVDTASSDRMGTPQVWEGKNVVLTGRKLIGATDPAKSEPGTIRGDFCIVMGRNIIHGSDAVESAQHEINLWFPEGAPLLAARAVWALRCSILASAPFGGCFQSTVLPATAVFQDCNSQCLSSQIQAPRCLSGLKMPLASIVLVPCPGALAALCTPLWRIWPSSVRIPVLGRICSARVPSTMAKFSCLAHFWRPSFSFVLSWPALSGVHCVPDFARLTCGLMRAGVCDWQPTMTPWIYE